MEAAFGAVGCVASLELLEVVLVVLAAVPAAVPGLVVPVALVEPEYVLVESDPVGSDFAEKSVVLVGRNLVEPAGLAGLAGLGVDDPVAGPGPESEFEPVGVVAEMVGLDLEDVGCWWWVVRVDGPEVTPGDEAVFVALVGE